MKHLTFWVLLAVVSGVVIGALAPETGKSLEPLALGFVEVLKVFVLPLIFLTVTMGIVSMGDLKRVGQIGGKALIYFEVVTTFALLIGIVVASMIRAGDGVLPPSDEVVAQMQGRMSEYRTRAEDFSWFHFIQDNTPLQVLILSIVSGW